MKRGQRRYDLAFKEEAVKLADKLGVNKASIELGIPENTLYLWRQKHRQGKLSIDVPHQPKTASRLADELEVLRTENEMLKRNNAQLTLENEILDKAARFFAQSQKK